MFFEIKVTENIEKIIQSVDAKKEKVELATMRALNKTALWVRSQAIKQVSKEKQVPRKLIKTRVGVYKASRKRLRSVVAVDTFVVKAGKLGTMKQTKIGAKAGKHMFKGAFIATMKGGHKGIFTRIGKKSLPIEEEEFDLCDGEIVKRIADNEAERAFEKYFHQQIKYMTRYVLE